MAPMFDTMLDKIINTFEQISVASISSVIGIFIGLVNLLRNIKVDRKKLHIQIGFEPQTGLGSSITFTVINKERRVIVVERAALVTTSGQEIQIRGREFPINLDENNPKVVFQFHVKHPNYSNSFTKGTKLSHFQVVDSHGKVWKFPNFWCPHKQAWRRETGFLANALEEKHEPE